MRQRDTRRERERQRERARGQTEVGREARRESHRERHAERERVREIQTERSKEGGLQRYKWREVSVYGTRTENWPRGCPKFVETFDSRPT